MLKYILIAVLLVGTYGCNERATTNTAQAIAAVQAAKKLNDQSRGYEANLVLDAAIAYQLAAVNIPLADLPAPAIPVTVILADPPKFASSAPPEPTPSTSWGWLGVAGLTALWGLGRVAPSIPVVGSAVGGLANIAWEFLSHRNQKTADTVATTTTDAARSIVPILEWIALNREALPEAVRAKIDLKTLDSLTTIASSLSKPA